MNLLGYRRYYPRPRALLQTLGLVLCLVFASTPQTSTSASSQRKNLQPTLILISLDGFRYDYLQKYKAPRLSSLAREGVQARWMTPSFPSLTFPNHYTIATGLYPEHHGIVGNEMYDPVFNATFSPSKSKDAQDSRWWGGEPIWVTAEKQGQHAAAYFYPGTEAEIAGKRPTYWKPYDGKVPNAERVDTALSWLDLPGARRPTFIALYFSDVDHAGHEHSPNSPETAKAIAEVDRAVGRLIDGLRRRQLYDNVNIIIVSDHGMAPVAPSHWVILDDFFRSKAVRGVVWGAQVTQLFPKQGKEAELFLSINPEKLEHAHCYRKQDIPARFHYQNSRRIAPIVCMADEGWKMSSRDRFQSDRLAGKLPTGPTGAHGYDNQLESMRAIFLAHGPAFKTGVMVDPIENVDVYDIMTGVLGLKPAYNDGDPKVTTRVLR